MTKNRICMNKAIAIITVLILSMTIVPITYAATPVALKASNVTEWPTAEGEIYYGEPLSKIKLVGGEVQYNGVVVPGHFEHIDSTVSAEIAMENYEADIKFVPDDTTAYKGFTKYYSKTTFNVHKTTPVLADESKPPVVVETVEPNVTLSTITISDGAMVNPYDNTESSIKKVTWKWTAPDTIVSKSGYYEAKFVASADKYVKLTRDIYIEVNSPIQAPDIVEYPTIPELTYNPDVTWSNIELSGGKAVVSGTDIEVAGTFAIKDFRLTGTPNPNFTQIEVVFTPANAEEALPYEFTIPVKVNPAPISFVDSDGNYIVDGYKYEATPGILMRDVLNGVKKYLNYPPQSVFVIEDANYAAQNGRIYKLTVIHDNPYYTGSELYFTVVFKNVEVAPTIAFAGYNQYKVDCGRYSPAGTFTITCNGKEIAEAKAGQPFDCEVYTDEGGTYEITAKYNPTENDYFIVSDASYSITVNPARNIKTVSGMHFTVNGSQTYNAIRTGDVIELTYNMPEFAYYVVKDGSGKTVTLEGVDLTSKKIKFTMPDFDLSFSVKTPAQLEQEEATANCDHLCHSDNQFIQLIWKLLHIIFRLFNVQQYCDCGITHYDAPIFG